MTPSFSRRGRGAWRWLLAVLLLAGAVRASAQPADARAGERSSDPTGRVAPAPAGFFLLSIPGGTTSLERLGIRPEERGYALLLLARALHGVTVSNPTGSLTITVGELFGTPAVASATGEGDEAVVLAPFSERTWRRALGLDERADLFTAIVRDRGALLVAGASLEAGAGAREWLSEQPRLLARLVKEWAGAYAQAARGLALNESRWTVPGDEAAWAALVGVPTSRLEEFLSRLVERDDGQLARFFATMCELPAERRAALLAVPPDEDVVATLGSLYDAARHADSPSSPNTHPYQLSYADLPSMLHALNDVAPDRLPRTAGWWPALVTSSIDSRDDAAALISSPPAVDPFAATVRALLRGSPRDRRDRLTMLSLARRWWDADAPPAAQADLLYAIGQYRRFRALLLTLDRIDVGSPAVWAGLVDMARRVDAGGGRERLVRLGLAQGSLALVERAALSGALPAEGREQVLAALATAVDDEVPIDAAVRGWLIDHFVPALPPLVQPDAFSGATAYESRILQALAGLPRETAALQLSWEGQQYTVNTFAAEHERILRIRALVPSPGLDAAVEGRNATALAAALRALAYTPALGDPDGAVTLSPDVVERHDFGGSRAAPGRDVAWNLAQERAGSGAPWHVSGSLFALDLALARSALRRMSADDMPAVPTINLNDELTLARSAVARRPEEFDDRARAEIVAAIRRGRDRVRGATANVASVMELAGAIALPRSVRQVAAWTLASMPQAGVSLFSLRDLLWLGRPALSREVLARWGLLGDSVDGRLAMRFDPPLAWDRLAGHPDTGVLATQAPDLLLRVAEITEELRVPSELLPALMLYATLDYWHEVEARFADDWPALVRAAAVVRPTRVEDYVAALGSAGPLRPVRN